MIEVVLYTTYFNLYRIHYAYQQLLIQNAFALTIHKIQEMSLDHISVSLDDTIFISGQAYTALSQGHIWEGVKIINLNWNAFLVNEDTIKEYE